MGGDPIEKCIVVEDKDQEVTFQMVESRQQKLLKSGDYLLYDISHETIRTISSFGSKLPYVIKRPVALIIRKGGSTHRVVDNKGVTHCYAAPEGGETVIAWESGEYVNF